MTRLVFTLTELECRKKVQYGIVQKYTRQIKSKKIVGPVFTVKQCTQDKIEISNNPDSLYRNVQDKISEKKISKEPTMKLIYKHDE